MAKEIEESLNALGEMAGPKLDRHVNRVRGVAQMASGLIYDDTQKDEPDLYPLRDLAAEAASELENFASELDALRLRIFTQLRDAGGAGADGDGGK